MGEDNKQGRAASKERRDKITLGNIFYHNTFVLIFSIVVALVMWFVMAVGSDTSRTHTVYDVPIVTRLSSEAEADGLRVFNMSYSTVDIEVSGNSLITSKLTAGDFEASVNLNPTSTKLTGNTLQKMTAQVRASKASSPTDYEIVSVSPEEVNLEYDRYKETTFTVENEIAYSADSGFYAGSPMLSDETVTVSGPESSVNKISRVAVVYTVANSLKSDLEVSCPVRLYDQNNQEIADNTGMYLSLSTDTIDVILPVMPRKTVNIVASTVRRPKGFSDSRITVTPSQIEIAGAQEVLDSITEIQLDAVIDFAELDISKQNTVTADIPMPSGVRNITNVGNNPVNQATVSINLNGYKQSTVTVPESNIQMTNVPAGLEPELTTKTLEVTLIGSEAQISKITGDLISVQADLTNYSDRTGNVDVPVSVTISGSGADSCWVVGKYSATITLVSKATILANVSPSAVAGAEATPQE